MPKLSSFLEVSTSNLNLANDLPIKIPNEAEVGATKEAMEDVHPSSRAPWPVYTYHHICSQLILASTHVLANLPRRASPSLDQAIILPLGSTSQTSQPADSDSDSETEGNTRQGSTARSSSATDYGYSVLLSAVYDKKQVVIRREDGFEKRALFRCGRCKVVLGYELDKTQFGGVDHERVGRVIYLLPEGLMTTEEMEQGKRFTEQEVVLGRG